MANAVRLSTSKGLHLNSSTREDKAKGERSKHADKTQNCALAKCVLSPYQTIAHFTAVLPRIPNVITRAASAGSMP